MKKKFLKFTLAVVLVAAAAFGGLKTYGSYNQTESELLLSENVEAQCGFIEWLLSKDYKCEPVDCKLYWATQAKRVPSGTGEVAWAWLCYTCSDIIAN